MQSGHTPYIERLDHLRFAAAALVVLFHSWLLSGGVGRDMFQFPPINQGYIGVPLFMVISGFILAVISFGQELDAPRFYLNRALRIYPLFLVVVSLGYFATPDPRPASTTLDFLMAILPISNLSRMGYGEFGGQLWSIAAELQFYLLFPILHTMLARRGPRYHLSLIALLLTLRAAVFVLHRDVYDLSYFSIFGCLDVFLIGHLCGWCYRRGGFRPSHPLWSIGLCAALGALVWCADRFRLFDHHSGLWIVWPDILAVAFAALILAYIACAARIPLSRVWATLGQHSYSIYCWHILVILLLQKIRWGTVNPYLFGMIVLAVTIPLAAASYHVIERPFLERRVRYTRAAQPEAALPLAAE